ncbi:hypothetical protein HK096_007223 [Nowakowskiella sp. JEL0078]|nr:hypothetical protein HK096_007223 [Nowakowskiella sp. JEL0078]
MSNQTFTLTYGDRAENHKGMQMIGELSNKGFSLDDLYKAKQWFEERQCFCELIELSDEGICGIGDTYIEQAFLLIIRNGVNAILFDIEKDDGDFFNEQAALVKDTKAFMYGRVVNKKARHNLCFGETPQEACYEEGKGTIVSFKEVPCLNRIRNMLPEIIGDAGKNLVVEGNYYYDIKKCGIGYHGDAERTKVVGVRLGETLPIFFQWYYKRNRIGTNMRFDINGGDIYIMSDKSVGRDWKTRNTVTLRHAAGCDLYTK